MQSMKQLTKDETAAAGPAQDVEEQMVTGGGAGVDIANAVDA
jgi:hypothetical protein